MALIAKRKLHQTWREAVAARSHGSKAQAQARCLALFDRIVASGRSEAEAAYRALSAHDLLWTVEGPGAPGPREEAAQARDPHRLPDV